MHPPIQVKCFVLFVTHYPLLADLEPKYPQMVANFHMAYVEVEESSESLILRNLKGSELELP